MPWRPHGRASVDPHWPRAWATCDRCGMNYNRDDLNWDLQIYGVSIINTRFLVCDRCQDDFQDQLRAISLPADPLPVLNPRVEPYPLDETNIRTTMSGDTRTTQSGDTRITQQTSGE